MKPANERRRHPRYQLGDGAMAVSANIPGNIENISKGGISFVYLSNEDPLQDGETVDILDGQSEFFMEGIPCRVVLRKNLVNGSSFSMIRRMQCSLEFGEMTKAQKVDLETYINKYSVLSG